MSESVRMVRQTRNNNVSLFSFTLHNQDQDTKFTSKVRTFALVFYNFYGLSEVQDLFITMLGLEIC